MLRQLCFLIVAVLLATTLVPSQLNAQVVSFSFEELALDGSNIDSSRAQHSAWNASDDDVTTAGVEWNKRSDLIQVTALGALFDRNNAPGAPDTNGNNAESFTGFASQDQYFDPSATGSESDLHNVIEDIVFQGQPTATIDVTINGLVPNIPTTVQFISWDAGVEGEGDGAAGTTKEFRHSIINATTAGASGSLEYNQFVVANTALSSADGLFGNSSDEITAALITAEFTPLPGQTSIDFSLSLLPGSTNDNAILNAVVVSVPEPSTVLLTSLGVIGLGLVRRWR